MGGTPPCGAGKWARIYGTGVRGRRWGSGPVPWRTALLLIDMGFTALAIADRVGHESIDITYRYAHLFPTRQTEMADRLDMERKGA